MDTVAAYTKSVSQMERKLEKTEKMTDGFATSLAEIDPNMENGAEGKAFVEKMYESRFFTPKETEPVMPHLLYSADSAGEMEARHPKLEAPDEELLDQVQEQLQISTTRCFREA